MDKICFPKEELSVYLFVLLCIISFLVYILYVLHKENVDMLIKIKTQEIQNTNNKSKDQQENHLIQNTQENTQALHKENKSIYEQLDKDTERQFLKKIYNPLYPPENQLPEGSFYTKPFNNYINYQMIGYLTGQSGQYPVFGRTKEPRRSDKWEYYLINDSRNRIKIPFKTKNYNEMYDGDNIYINELNETLIFKKYENESVRYNPDML